MAADFSAGIDVGSAVIKVAIVESDEGGTERLVAGRAERIRRRDPQAVARDVFDATVREARLETGALTYVATTGEGETIPFRTGHFYGMTTHARGGVFLEPEARAVIDMGALHTRAVAMDPRGKVLGYRMTSQCASGSGQFLENIARYLGVSLAEVGALSLSATRGETVSSICAVLAETDVINMVSRGVPTREILRGIHESMAGRLARLLQTLAVSGVVFVTGGLAADDGLVGALERALAPGAAGGTAPVPARHALSAFAGAIGAAIWGEYRYRKLGQEGVSWKSEAIA